jgi:uncharacterized protein YqeY
MKSGDRVAVAALRATLSAIDNAEAVERSAGVDSNLAIEQLAVGVGAAEAERRDLTEDQVEAIVRGEIAEREAAAHAYDVAGRTEQATRLRAEIAVLTTHLSR